MSQEANGPLSESVSFKGQDLGKSEQRAAVVEHSESYQQEDVLLHYGQETMDAEFLHVVGDNSKPWTTAISVNNRALRM